MFRLCLRISMQVRNRKATTNFDNREELYDYYTSRNREKGSMIIFQQYYSNIKQDKQSFLFYIKKCVFTNVVAVKPK